MPGCGAVGSARLLGSRGRWFKSSHPDHFLYQGVAQLVARSVRDAEVVSSSLITLTIYLRLTQSNSALRCGYVKSGVQIYDDVWDWRSLVARTHGVREVASSNLVSQTIFFSQTPVSHLGTGQNLIHRNHQKNLALSPKNP